MKPILSISGDSRPQSQVPKWVPADLRQLLTEHGSGLLCGFIKLTAPGSEAHRELTERFDALVEARRGCVGWLVRDAGLALDLCVLGELTLNRGFIVCDTRKQLEKPARRLLLLHRSGGVYPLGSDLGPLVEAMQRGQLLELESGLVPSSLLPYDDVLAVQSALERPREQLAIEASYDLRPEMTGAELDALLGTDDSDAWDAGFERFMSWGIPAERLRLAREVAASAGERGADLADTVSLLERRRRSSASRLDSIRDRIHDWLSEQSWPEVQQLNALGFEAQAVPTLETVELAGAHRFLDLLNTLQKQMKTAEAQLSAEAWPLLRDALRQTSPSDAVVMAALLSKLGTLGRATSLELPQPVGPLPVRPLSAPPPKWLAAVAPMERLWPLALLLALPHAAGAMLMLLSDVRDPRLVVLLDEYLRLQVGRVSISVAIRTAIRPLTEEDVERIDAELSALPQQQERAAREDVLLQLLMTTFALPAGFAAIRKHVARNALYVVRLAEGVGATAQMLQLLAAVWSHPKSGLGAQYEAAKLGAAWDDPGAVSVLPQLEARIGKADERSIKRADWD